MPSPESFKLAPMSRAIRATTSIYFALSAVLFVLLPPAGAGGAFMVLMLVAAFAWLWMRPSAFVVDAEALLICWPLRKRWIPLGSIESARAVQVADLGYMLRIGVGGLFGAFGLFKTGKEGLINGYFSTGENMVLLKIKGSRPLLISPDEAAEFIKMLLDK